MVLWYGWERANWPISVSLRACGWSQATVTTIGFCWVRSKWLGHRSTQKGNKNCLVLTAHHAPYPLTWGLTRHNASTNVTQAQCGHQGTGYRQGSRLTQTPPPPRKRHHPPFSSPAGASLPTGVRRAPAGVRRRLPSFALRVPGGWL